MQGLMYRLAELDADSAGLVRVIDYFDALVRHGADLASFLRASATLADCVVGIETSGHFGSQSMSRYDPRGQWSPWPRIAPTTVKDIVIGDVAVGTVWIERAGDRLPLDDMLVDRMALTAAIIVQPRRPLTDAEHTRNLLFPVGELAVLTACASLRIEPSAAVRVIVSRKQEGVRLPISRESTPGRAKEVEIDGDSLGLVLESPVQACEFANVSLPPGTRAGISLVAHASEVHTMIDTARFARGQASDTNPVVNADDLGALILLARGPNVDQNRIPDIVRAQELRRTDNGVELLATLRVYLRFGTLRAAADSLHLHHSSVAHRLAKLSHHVGFNVDTFENRSRATAMIMVLDGT